MRRTHRKFPCSAMIMPSADGMTGAQIPVYCDHQASLPLILEQLRLVGIPSVSRDLEDYLERLGSPGCAVAGIRILHDSRLFRSLCALGSTLSCAVVLVTARSADNARSLKDGVFEEVIWFEEIGPKLSHAARNAISQRELRSLSTRISSLPHIRPRLRRAMAAALSAPAPPLRVEELASLSGCDRTTLWDDWHRCRLPGTPKTFLQWALLLHARARKQPGAAWRRIAAELGVDERTISRVAQRLLGARGRRTVGEMSSLEIHDAFEAAFMGPASASVIDAASAYRVPPTLHRLSHPLRENREGQQTVTIPDRSV
jgi:hypothetical protein